MASLETLTYEFLAGKVAEINAEGDETHPLYQAEVLKDESEEIKADRGIRIGPCVSRPAPGEAEFEIKEYDAPLTIIFYVRIGRGDVQNRAVYRDAAIEMAKAAAMLFIKNPDMGGRVDNCRSFRIVRVPSEVDASKYAATNLVVILNETFTINFDGR